MGVNIMIVELIDKWTGELICNLDWCEFEKGLKCGEYLITTHSIEFKKCNGENIHTFKVYEVEQFDLVKEWTGKNCKVLECRLNMYNVYPKFSDGLMIISDKGMLIDKEKIARALGIGNIPISEIPCVSMGVGNCAVENTLVINMTRLLEVIEEYKGC